MFEKEIKRKRSKKVGSLGSHCQSVSPFMLNWLALLLLLHAYPASLTAWWRHTHKYTHTLYLASCTDLVICQLIERKRKRRRQLLPSVARLSFLLFLRLWLCRLVSFSLHLHWTVSCDGKWAVTDLTGQHRRRRRRWRHFKFHFLIAQPMWHDS